MKSTDLTTHTKEVEFYQKNLEFEKRRAEVEDELHQFWTPHLGQIPIAQALFRGFLRYIFLQCGRKFGKTDFAIYCLYLFCILFPDSHCYYVADTAKHGGELVWDNGRLPNFFTRIKRLRGETAEQFYKRKSWGQKLADKYILKVNNSDMRVYFTNGSWVKVEGAENFANADGLEPAFMVYDEFKSHDPRFNEAMEPNLRVYKAPLLIIGTPPEEPSTYYEKIANSVKSMTYGAWFKRPSYMNSHIYKYGKDDPEFVEECEKYIKRGDEDVMMRELYAEIVVSGSKAIFPVLKLPEFDYEENKYIGYSDHVRPHSELIKRIDYRPKDWEFYDIYDAGSVTCFAVLIAAVNKYTKEVLILDEVYETDQRLTTTGNIYPEATSKRMKVYGWEDSWNGAYDHAAAWFAGEVQDRYGRSLNPCTKDLASRSENKKEIKLSMIKEMLVMNLILISENCPKMIWEMTNYRKDKNGKIPKINDHLIDCLRYLLNECHYMIDYSKRPELPEYLEDRRLLTHDEDLEDNRSTDYGLPSIYKEDYE